MGDRPRQGHPCGSQVAPARAASELVRERAVATAGGRGVDIPPRTCRVVPTPTPARQWQAETENETP